MREDTLAILVSLLIITSGLIYLNLGISQYSLAYIVSGSMEPTYYKGDLIIMKKARASEINLGDVIIFKSPRDPKTLILHRVVSLKFVNGKYYFLTKGDNPRTNPEIDFWGWVPEDNLVGKLVYRVPLLGALAEVLSINYIRYTLILTIITLIVLSLFEEKYKETEEKRNKIKLSRHEISLKIIAIIILFCLSTSTAVLKLNNGARHNVLVEKVNFYQLYDETEDKYINYAALTLIIESNGYWISSIREIEVGLLVRYGGVNVLLGKAIWTIVYYFHGTKKVSVCLLINDTAFQILINNSYEKVFCEIKIHIESIISGVTLQEKSFAVQDSTFFILLG